MAIPDCQSFMLPLLKIASDGNEHRNLEVYETLAQQFVHERMETVAIDKQADDEITSELRLPEHVIDSNEKLYH